LALAKNAGTAAGWMFVPYLWPVVSCRNVPVTAMMLAPKLMDLPGSSAAAAGFQKIVDASSQGDPVTANPRDTAHVPISLSPNPWADVTPTGIQTPATAAQRQHFLNDILTRMLVSFERDMNDPRTTDDHLVEQALESTKPRKLTRGAVNVQAGQIKDHRVKPYARASNCPTRRGTVAAPPASSGRID
jgi:hypothetical protein